MILEPKIFTVSQKEQTGVRKQDIVLNEFPGCHGAA